MEGYLGAIVLWACDFEPEGWMFCHGQELSIQKNAALYSLIGTKYGGDGKLLFKLPDLRGRFAVGVDGTGVVGAEVPLAAQGGHIGISVTPDEGATAEAPVLELPADVRTAYLGLNFIICVSGLYPPRP